MCQLGFLEATMLSPPPRKVQTKGAKKKVRSTPKETSTSRIPSCYDRLALELTNHEVDISETFFPIKGRPPLNPKTHIMCLGLIFSHFVLVFFLNDYPIPISSMECKLYKSEEAET
jgi:hypothetical protein